MSWTREQRNVTIAAYLGWTLDAFDFFLMVFILKDIAAEFNTKIPNVAFAITLTRKSGRDTRPVERQYHKISLSLLK